MENTSNNSSSPPQTSSFSWAIFANRILKTAFSLLVFGAVFIILIKFNVAVDHIAATPEPIPVAAGAIVLVALTLLGVSTVPAAIAGVAAWWLIQNFL